MATILLTPEFILNGLKCPEGKNRVEYCDRHTAARGLYVEVNASNPGHGIYRVRLKVDGKSTHFVVGKTESVTLDAARRQTMLLREQVKAGINPKASNEKSKLKAPTLRDAFATFLTRAKLTKRSWIRDVQAFKHVDVVYGDRRITEITRQMVLDQQTEMMNSGLYKPATVNHSTKLVRHLMRLCVQEGLLDRSPVSGIQLLPENNMVENYMNDVELAQLLKVLTTHDNQPVCLMARWLLSTGARSGEAKKARYADIDRERRLWKIPAANSKGKTAGSVFLNDSALAVLDELPTRGTHDYLFVNPRTGQPYSTIAKSWERIRVLAKLPKLRVHDLRHQHAVLLINSGRTLFEVATALRHRDPNSTTVRYAHLTSKTMQDVSNCADIAIKRAMAVAVEA